ncbi:MAG TPA: S8 family serine peptidase [Gemmatimonadaceae bacterium]|nr:S8 family serine peptidase [Gemmatimonadaceae bacterium]
MRLRSASVIALLAAAAAAACKEQSPVPHTPNHIVVVSGANQSGNTSAALDSALVVQVLDGAGRSVSGVTLTWTVVGGGSLSATSTVTDNDGKSKVTWTLAPTAGTQVVTVTSANISGASVSFVANNGATISGVVTPANTNIFGATFSRSPARSLGIGSQRTVTRRPMSNRIVVGFRNDKLGVAAAGSGAYRSMSVARNAMLQLQSRAASLAASHPLRNARVSPAMLATRFEVTDTTQIDAVMASLRTDPNVAWVERDEIVSIRGGLAPRPQSAAFAMSFDGATTPASEPARNIVGKFPNDPFLLDQLWTANMVDLPRAWSITTGSKNVVVAVVDMGIRFDHPNITANLTSDGYDFVDQVGFGDTESICDGTTFTTIDGDGDGPDADPTDPDDLEFDDADGCWQHNDLGDHGLWTAGIIGDVGNQALGVAGVNWNVKIRPIRVLGITGDGTNFDIAQGVLYAAGLPAAGANNALVQAPSRAQIINMSLGGGASSNTLASAVAAASNAGSLLVASAGNDGLDLQTFPAALPNVMGVAAVGMDGALATYSNAGTFISVSAPGGDFRLDDNGGGGVLGPGWDFTRNRSTYLFGYGTSASAPFVSGIAALLLAQDPSLTATQLRSRIEQYATRGTGLSRSDVYGWGIVNAYNSLTQQNGPPRSTIAQLVDATTGTVARSTTVATNGNFVFTKLSTGTYYLRVGDDESSDGVIGTPGRRFAMAGGLGAPTVFNVNGSSQSAAIVLGLPMEVEPNDDMAHANTLTVGSYVVGTITTPDVRDMYAVQIPTLGTYTFETSGLVGACGLGIELDTFLSLSSSAGTVVATNDNFTSPTAQRCSRIQTTLGPGIYYVSVTAASGTRFATHGRYRLEVRSGQ